MTPIGASKLLMHCFAMWSRLGWAAGQMTSDAMQVIGHRATRFAFVGLAPSMRDQREFALMGEEKSAAVLEAAQAVGVSFFGLNQRFAALAFKQALSTSKSLTAIAASRTRAESVGHQSALMRNMISEYVVTTSKISGSAAQLARRALKPISTRVSGNLKRLGKVSK